MLGMDGTDVSQLLKTISDINDQHPEEHQAFVDFMASFNKDYGGSGEEYLKRF